MQLLRALPAFSLLSLTISHPMSDAEAPSANPIIVARGATLSYYPWIAQYNVTNCSSGLITDKRVWPKVSGAGVVHNTKIEPRRYIYPHSPDSEQCVPWYPVVDQQHGRSVGISFGTNNESISQLQIFKESPECAAAYNDKTKERGSLTPWECCDGSNGLLGVINANGTSDAAFGVRNGLGSNPGACVNVGKDGNQSFWQMRYFKAIV